MLRDCHIIILASGFGKRFKNSRSIPKQLLLVEGRPVFSYALNTAMTLVLQEKVLLTYPPGMKKAFQSLLKKINAAPILIEGGERRQDSVSNALEHIKNKNGVVLIHDSARPFASTELFKRVYNGAVKTGACIPVIKSPDTVKELRSGFVKKTIDRESLGLAQTPQGFNIALLRKVFAGCDEADEYTDEAGLLESQGCKVSVVEGERHNLKLTFSEDLSIIKTLAVEYGKNRHRY
jgi:2-C-methyl-D-erythritol 4-phosphate cytidylyltransferase